MDISLFRASESADFMTKYGYLIIKKNIFVIQKGTGHIKETETMHPFQNDTIELSLCS